MSDLDVIGTVKNNDNKVVSSIKEAIEATGTTRPSQTVYVAGAAGPQGPQGIQGPQGEKGDTGAKLVNRTFLKTDENGGNVYLDVFDDGTTAEFTAPKGEKGDSIVTGVFAMEVNNGDLLLYQNNLENAEFTIGADGYMRVNLGG